MDTKKVLFNEYTHTSSTDSKYKLIKKCPHCNKTTKLPENTTYVICGYNDKKMDNNNKCGKDWCFKCGKRLCKSLFIDDLFEPKNRFHTNNCCYNYAQFNDLDYPAKPRWPLDEDAVFLKGAGVQL